MPQISQRLNVSKAITGGIISLFPVGSVLASLLVGKYQSTIGKLAIVNGLIYCTFLSMILFGLAMSCDNREIYLILASIARVLQGACVGGISAVLYSLVP